MSQRFTGLVKRKGKAAKTDQQIAEQPASAEARVNSLPQDQSLAIKRALGPLPASDNKRSKRRILPTFLSRRQHGREALPEDPFLASLDRAKTGAEQELHSPSVAADDGATSDRQQLPMAPPVETPANSFSKNTEKTSAMAERSTDADNPFADVAKTRRSHSDSKRTDADSTTIVNTFVDGFDSQWEQLRGTKDNCDTSIVDHKLAETTPSVDPDLLRQVITGSTNDPKTNVATRPADSETGVPSLPKWAQQSTPEPQDSITFDRQTLRDDGAEPSPAAIVIVPAGRKNSLDSPPEMPLDGKASSRVELLASPTEPKNDRSDMIVETQALPPGFAVWRGDGENAIVRTNSPIRGPSTGSTAGDFGWAGSHANLPASSNSRPTDKANADRIAFVDIGSQYEGPAVVTELEPRPIENVLPAGPGRIKKTKPSEPAVTAHGQAPDVETRLFLFPDDSRASEESSLETVNWNSESEPGVGKNSSIVGSRAVVGLLIGLACLIGLVVVRRRRATI